MSESKGKWTRETLIVLQIMETQDRDCNKSMATVFKETEDKIKKKIILWKSIKNGSVD